MRCNYDGYERRKVHQIKNVIIGLALDQKGTLSLPSSLAFVSPFNRKFYLYFHQSRSQSFPITINTIMFTSGPSRIFFSTNKKTIRMSYLIIYFIYFVLLLLFFGGGGGLFKFLSLIVLLVISNLSFCGLVLSIDGRIAWPILAEKCLRKKALTRYSNLNVIVGRTFFYLKTTTTTEHAKFVQEF